MGMLLRQSERVVVYGGLAAAVLLGLSSQRWGEAAIAQNAGSGAGPIRLATVDILGVTERLVDTEKYRSARDTHITSLNKGLDPLVAEMKDLLTRFQSLPAGSPDAEPLRQQLGDRQQRLQQSQAEARAQIEQFNTLQVGEAYRIVLEAADSLGGQSGYSHVIATRSGATNIKSTNVPGAVQEILARPIIKGSAADDLTERLLKQLGLDGPAPVKAEPVKP